MKRLHVFKKYGIVFIVAYCFWGVPVFADYRTPDTGTTYTLASLVPLSGGAVQETASGYLITDKVIISPSDSLEITSQVLYINPYTYKTPELNPCIAIEGWLKASNSHFLPDEIPESGDSIPDCTAIYMAGAKVSGTPEAEVTSCTFKMLKNNIICGKSNVTIERCRFEISDSGSLYLYSKSIGIVTDCIFEKSFVVVSDSKITMDGCSFEEGNISLMNVSDESLIKIVK